MPKMGRPRKDTAKRKAITIRMSESTHEALTKYADEHHLSVTEVTLRSLEEYLSKRKTCHEIPVLNIEGGNEHGEGTKR